MVNVPGYYDIGQEAKDVRKSELVTQYTDVVINVAKDAVKTDDQTIYSYRWPPTPDNSGLTLEFDCPWGTEQMAHDVYDRVHGYQYQPFTATDAVLDPAVEMGDAVTANDVTSGLYTQDATFGTTYYCDISAPQDEQLDHEFSFESPTERRITRQKNMMSAEFAVQEAEISAKVSQEGGNASSFGWYLKSDKFELKSGNTAVFTCDSEGIKVHGRVEATTGFFGSNSTNGFTIGSRAMYNPSTKDSYSSTVSGVYIGTDGINLGNGAFKVSASGQLSASSGSFSGTVYASSLSGQIVSNQIGAGEVQNGNIGGGAVTGGKISGGSVSKGKTDSGVQSSLNNGDSAKATVDDLVAGRITATALS